ncbi:MAG: 3',5'-cyclic-nucleotide phosphodiesterase [Thermoanaerobaculum sp.]|nr:3',5'-cyclic-nucleotide phosphodiesterase [Thermoanaerobaculum sp.]
MEWRILGSFGGSSPACRMTSFLVDGTLALDAGSLTQALTVPEQERVSRIVLSHSHLDHVASIPFLVENVFADGAKTLEILLTPEVHDTVKRHLFNNDLWPDFTRIPSQLAPAVKLVQMQPRVPFAVGHLTLTPIPVNHTVPTCGFLVEEQGGGAVLFTSDTGPTQEVWEAANRCPNLRALIVEVSFPSRLQRIADLSLHLTPQTLAQELQKLSRQVPVYLYHLKPRYLEELRQELSTTPFPQPVVELQQGETYRF